MITQEEVTTAEIDAAVTLSSLCISLITAEIKRNKHIVLSRPVYRALETLRAGVPGSRRLGGNPRRGYAGWGVGSN